MDGGQDQTNASTTTAQTEELRPGTRLLQGQYVVERFLNAGGFGMTYLARDSLDRRIVLKECFPNSMCCRDRVDVRARNRSSQREFEAVVRLFGHEARRLAGLKHPNIVGIHQVFEANGTAYMALDFVRGRELLEVIEDPKVRLTPNQTRFILRKVLKAVQYIHEHDVLHRDISPDNILIQPNGNPVLIDFGAAREEASKASRALSHIHVVKDGYSPQEFYIQGSQQDPSSDLYSLAATFYHLITGHAPPTSQERVAAIAAGKEDPYRPLINHVRSFDEHFLGALDQAMCPFPKDRMSSADEWLERIDTVRRQNAALEKARKDSQIEASIQALVAATNNGTLDEVDLTKPRLSREIAREAPVDVLASKQYDRANSKRSKRPRRSFLARIFSRNRNMNDQDSQAGNPTH
jgi:serine/threonine protein kinase